MIIYKIAIKRIKEDFREFRKLAAKLLGLFENIIKPCQNLNNAFWKNNSVHANYVIQIKNDKRSNAQRNLKKTTNFCSNSLD